VLLLSVHHQWISNLTETEADELFQAAVSRAKKAAFVEFAALNRKFGFKDEFIDNDVNTLTEYAMKYLSRLAPKAKVKYLGKSPEAEWEPFRYMFLMEFQ
jgi:hypothetical protein